MSAEIFRQMAASSGWIEIVRMDVAVFVAAAECPLANAPVSARRRKTHQEVVQESDAGRTAKDEENGTDIRVHEINMVRH